MAALAVRAALFAVAVALFAADKKLLDFGYGISALTEKPWLGILWLALMGQLIFHLFHNIRKTKRKNSRGRGVGGDEKTTGLAKSADRGALKVAMLWIAANAVIYLLYFFKVIGRGELLLITLFYFTCDLIAVLFFCPFSKFIMHNKCCMTCRIYDWGAIMAYTPMFFVPSFFSLTLAGASFLIFINWEIAYARAPELFFENTDKSLSCAGCTEKLCSSKRVVDGVLCRKCKGKEKRKT